jgi:hypothetical protein
MGFLELSLPGIKAIIAKQAGIKNHVLINFAFILKKVRD